MTLTELSTAAQFNIGVKIIILNNEEQGMVTQWQSIFYEDRFAHTHQKNPDFVKLGDAMGVQAQRCIAPNDVEAKLKWLIENDGPALLEIVTDKKVPVLPMVEAGSGLHEMRVYDESKSPFDPSIMPFHYSNAHANFCLSERKSQESETQDQNGGAGTRGSVRIMNFFLLLSIARHLPHITRVGCLQFR